MYTGMVMTEAYRVVRRGETCETLEDAKRAARQLQIEVGQVFAVVDENNLVHWRGGTVKAVHPRSKTVSVEKA